MVPFGKISSATLTTTIIHYSCRSDQYRPLDQCTQQRIKMVPISIIDTHHRNSFHQGQTFGNYKKDFHPKQVVRRLTDGSKLLLWWSLIPEHLPLVTFAWILPTVTYDYMRPGMNSIIIHLHNSHNSIIVLFPMVATAWHHHLWDHDPYCCKGAKVYGKCTRDSNRHNC